MARIGWIKFFPGDWNGDIELASCSLEAQGLLARLLNVLHHANPYGYLLCNGKKPASETISRIIGVEKEEYERGLAELVKRGVLKQDETGLYNKRMVADQEKRDEMRRRGSLGGNPILVNPEDNQEVNPVVNHMDKPKVKADKEKEKETCFSLSFAEFWEAYPRKVEKGKAYRVWKARLREGIDSGSLIQASANYAEDVRKRGTAPNFVKHPATFLGPDKPYEEYAKRECKNEGVPLSDLSEKDIVRCGCPECTGRFENKPEAVEAEAEREQWAEARMSRYLKAYTEWEASGFEGPGPTLEDGDGDEA